MERPRARRVYRALMRILPDEMRCRFGQEMEEVFVHRLNGARDSTARSARVWLAAITDLVVQAAASRRDQTREDRWHMQTIMQDVRYGVRAAVAAPGLALVAILTLGLGIGASTATFSVVHAVLLEDYPFDDPDRLVFVWPEHNANKAMTLLAAERMSSLQRISGLSSWALTLTGEGEPRELDGLLVASGYFEMLGVRPALGRTFTPDEELPGQAGVVILSHGFWVEAFGADPGVVDRVVDLGGAEYQRRRVIGVMPPGVEDFWRHTDVWIPLEGDPALALADDDTWYVNDRLARLAPGATLAQANAEVRQYAAEVQRALPDQVSPEEAAAATVRPVRAHLTRNVGTAIRVALGAVALVLLIGCFNVANLLLARGDSRARDLAVRAALGAGRTRMTRMLLAEAGLLGLIGGALGIASALVLVRLIARLAPDGFPSSDAIAVSPNVLLFALGVTLLSTLVAGLVPALRVGRVDATAALAGGARGAVAHTGGRLTSALVGGQIALAVIVTVGSGLMLRSLTTLLAVDPGLQGEGVLALKPNPPTGRYPDGTAFQAYYEQVVERVAALPGIESVGAIHILPGGTDNWSFPTFPEGWVAAPGAPTPSVNFRAVRGDYFRTVRIPLVAGRAPGDSDRADTEPVVAVNEAYVARFWPGEEALGKTLSIFSPTGTRHRVVGVVADVRQHTRDAPPLPEMYFSHGQVPWNQMWMWIVARVRSGSPMDQARAVQEAIWSIDPDVPISGIAELADVLGQSTRMTRFMATLLTAFGALALVLSGVGVYGVTAYTSGRRRPEFGVRLALGSSRSQVVRSAAGHSLVPVAVGLAVGIVGAAASSSLLASVLYEIEPSDPTTFAGVTAILGVVGLLAAVVPAWRVSRVDPVSVLGSE